MSMFSRVFYFIVDHGIIEPGHGGEVVHGLTTNEKRFIFKLMENVHLPGVKSYGTQMVVHTGTRISDVSLAR